MPTYYSPNGNPEVWPERPEAYRTPEEWNALHPPEPAEVTPPEFLRRLRGTRVLQHALTKLAAEAAPLSDTEMADVAALDLFDAWTAGETYAIGKRLTHEGGLYEVVQAMTAQAHQPPGAAGMLAVYRLVDPAVGTVEDPKTLVVGLAVEPGLHYRYNGAVYRLARTLAVAVQGQLPGDPGMDTFWVVG